MADELVIEIVLDDGSVQKGLVKIEKEAENTGKKLSGSLERSFLNVGKAVGKLGLTIAGVGASIATALVSRQAIAAAQVQQDAVNQLNQSLVAANRFSQEASQGLQDYAASIEATTTVGDEVVLQQLALAQTFARSNEEAQKLVDASLDLAAAQGISLESAVRNLGKTFSGLTGELGEALPQIRGLTADQLRAGEAVDVIAARFDGFAESLRNTFSGAISASSNAFGSFLEEIGFFVTNSPEIRKAINFITDELIGLTNQLKVIRQDANFNQIINDIINFSRAAAQILIPTFETIATAVSITFRTLRQTIGTAVLGITSTASVLVGFFSPEGELATNLRLFNEELRKDLSQNALAIGDLFSEFAEPGNTDSVVAFIDNLQQAINVSDGLNRSLASTQDGLKDTAEIAEDSAKQINSIFQQAAVNGISKSVQSITKSLVEGGNAFAAFGATALNILGDFAIQLGTFFISTGLGIDKLKAAIISFQGGLAVAAGVALVAIGAALKSFSGGPAAVNGGGATAVTPVDPDTGFAPVETPTSDDIQAEESRINVNIQGDVFDTEETGFRIVEIINDSFSRENSQVVAS